MNIVCIFVYNLGTQEEAAEAYDIAAIKFRGLNAVTNFDMSRYDVKSILESSTLPIGGAAKRLKDVEQAEITVDTQRAADDDTMSSQLTDGIGNYHGGWPALAFQQAHHHQPFSMHYPYGSQRVWCKQEQDSDPTNNNHGFHQDLHHHQFQSAVSNNNTHNFFQPSSVLHNLMGMDSTSMEHSSGSNNIYSTTTGGGHHGEHGNGGYVIPMATIINSNNENQSHGFGDSEQVKALGYENLFGATATDPYHGRNLYYLSQQSAAVGHVVKAGVYDQGSACNNWVPTAVPTLGPRSSNLAAVCHGAPTFTVWNDT